MNSTNGRISGRHVASFVTILGWAVLALGGALTAQEGTAERPPPSVATPVSLWIEVLDERGRVAGDLDREDLQIREGSAAATAPTALVADALRRRAVGVEPTRIVLYFDQSLSGPGTVRRAAESLQALARRLTDLGEVELVTVGEEPEIVLQGRDELVLGERLGWTAVNDPGEGRILALREQVLQDLRQLAVLPDPSAEEMARLVVTGIAEELDLVRRRQEQLVAFLSSRPGSGPRLVVLVSDGYDLDPVGFYSRRLDEATRDAVVFETMEVMGFETEMEGLARAVAATGWTVVPFVPEGAGKDSTFEPTLLEGTDVQGQTATGVGVTIRPGSIFRRRKQEQAEEIPAPRLLDATAPLKLLADASGGELLTRIPALEDFLNRFAGRFEVTYFSELSPDADIERLTVVARRPGLVVRAPRWASRGVPEAVVAVRLKELLRGTPAIDDLDVAAVLELGDETGTGVLEARLGLAELYGDAVRPGDASFRVTIAVAVAGGEPRLVREVRTGQDLRGLDEWLYRTNVDVPEEATQIAILIEDLGLRRWGGNRASVVSGRWTDTQGSALPGPPILEIVRPEAELLRGRLRFETQVFDRRVDRLLYQLGERDAAELDRPPWTARIDLGRSPRRQTLTVIAFDAEGEELGRDSVILNAGSGGLSVEIVRPKELVGTGSVEFEAAVAVPVKTTLDRVLFFWNNDVVATLYGPPFKHRIHIPAEESMGYVRVVAMLSDGTVAEDVAFMNGPKSGERIDVNLVELYVVVTDERSRPVRGLRQEDFRIREEGREQTISTFSDASDLPLTLGMAIDSSASMFVKLPAVQRSAIDFLKSTFSEDDRAFVVDFDSQPRLVRSTTGQLDRVVRSIENLEANGRTALWESVVYSLVQLQGVRGRKALIVFSDGADEDENFPFRSCLNFSRKMGVPIYLILMRKAPPKDPGALSLLTRSFKSRVDRLVASTGGRVFYAKEYESLDAVYDEIETELRSQYLLTYYPNTDRGSSWRDVDVAVTRKGLRPRTLSGYWP